MRNDMSLSKAFSFAQKHHAGELKKGTESPFLYHPMAVAALVLKYGGSDSQTQAALVHDVVANGRVSEAEISAELGPEVARLAFTFVDPPLAEVPEGTVPSWSDLKRAYLGKLKSASEEALMIVACEELHDGGELLHDLHYGGHQVWKRFPVHAMEVTWYYKELLALFVSKLRGDRYRALLGEFGAMVRVLKDQVFETAGTSSFWPGKRS